MRQLLTRAAASEQEAIQLKPMIEAILRQNTVADKQRKMREADLKHMTAALDLTLESAEENWSKRLDSALAQQVVERSGCGEGEIAELRIEVKAASAYMSEQQKHGPWGGPFVANSRTRMVHLVSVGSPSLSSCLWSARGGWRFGLRDSCRVEYLGADPDFVCGNCLPDLKASIERALDKE